MTKTAITLLALAASIGTGAAAASPVKSSKAIVTDFYETAFVRHQPTVAARYLADRYVQHNPHVPNGTAAFTGFFERYFREHPTASSKIYRVVAEGDLVVIHSHAKESPEDAGLALIDIFRVDHGKIVEHWDVQQPVVVKTANGNTMFDGDNAK